MKLSKLFTLSWFEFKIFVKSWFLYAKWDFLISKCHYNRWQISLAEDETPVKTIENAVKIIESSVKKIDDNQLQYIIKIIQINEKAGRNHFRYMNCLRRCLCQKSLLSSYAIHSKLHIGVKFTNSKLAAHSWLSVNDYVINDSNEVISTYKELIYLNDSNPLLLLK